jgi:hypothetical protein
MRTNPTPGGTIAFLLLSLALGARPAAAQFRDDFEGRSPVGWATLTGDGQATAELTVADGHGTLAIDATRDRDDIWWVLIKRNIAASLDQKRLARAGAEVRVEARVRVPVAPRRVHTQVNTQRTTNFHLNLREYDLPDTLWHTIAMTTRGLDAHPGDSVFVELALTDAGIGHAALEVDYYRGDVVDTASAPPDLGEPMRYQPPPRHANPEAYGRHLRALEVATIDAAFPTVSFRGWREANEGAGDPVASVGGTTFTILRWDVRGFAGWRAVGNGVLELTTSSVRLGPDDPEEYGQVRVVEILGGDPAWERRTVTLARLTGGRALEDVLNPQMVIDSRVAGGRGARTRITISRAVLQRLLDGRTHGLLLRALGPIDAAFRVAGADTPTLHFDVAPGAPREVP